MLLLSPGDLDLGGPGLRNGRREGGADDHDESRMAETSLRLRAALQRQADRAPSREDARLAFHLKNFPSDSLIDDDLFEHRRRYFQPLYHDLLILCGISKFDDD